MSPVLSFILQMLKLAIELEPTIATLLQQIFAGKSPADALADERVAQIVPSPLRSEVELQLLAVQEAAAKAQAQAKTAK